MVKKKKKRKKEKKETINGQDPRSPLIQWFTSITSEDEVLPTKGKNS